MDNRDNVNISFPSDPFVIRLLLCSLAVELCLRSSLDSLSLTTDWTRRHLKKLRILRRLWREYGYDRKKGQWMEHWSGRKWICFDFRNPASTRWERYLLYSAYSDPNSIWQWSLWFVNRWMWYWADTIITPQERRWCGPIRLSETRRRDTTSAMDRCESAFGIFGIGMSLWLTDIRRCTRNIEGMATDPAALKWPAESSYYVQWATHDVMAILTR